MRIFKLSSLHVAALVLIAVLTSSILTYTWVGAVTGEITIDETSILLTDGTNSMSADLDMAGYNIDNSTLYMPYSYLIYVVDDGETVTYYAKNGTDGNICWSSTNASYVLQTSFDAVNASNKGTVYIKSANYYVDSPLTSMWRGDIIAEQGTSLEATATLTSVMLTIPSYASKIVINNLRFEALGYSAENVKIEGGTSHFNNVEFYGATTYGVWLTSSTLNDFYRCKWSAAATGINMFLDGTGASVTANFNSFRENIFLEGGLHHVLADGRASQNLFEHNIFEATAMGSTYAVLIRGNGASPYGNVLKDNWFESDENVTTVEIAIVLDSASLAYAPRMTKLINNHIGLYQQAFALNYGNGTKIENTYTSGIASGYYYLGTVASNCYNTEIIGGTDVDGLRVSNAGLFTQFKGEGYECTGVASGTTAIQVDHPLKGQVTVLTLAINEYATYYNMSWNNVDGNTFEIHHDKGSSATVTYYANYRPGS